METVIVRYLGDFYYEYSILTRRHFKESRDVLEGKIGVLGSHEMEINPHKTCSLKKSEENTLQEFTQVGKKHPSL